jgi:hypothetical protein
MINFKVVGPKQITLKHTEDNLLEAGGTQRKRAVQNRNG